jgi:hypothetical protein|nr:hypothetical protein [Neorhizobium tomejilense]
MKDTSKLTAIVEMENLNTLARGVIARAMEVIAVKVSAIRLVTEADEVEAVRETEALDVKLREWYRQGMAAHRATEDAVAIFREATERDGPQVKVKASTPRIEWLKEKIASVEAGVQAGAVREAETCARSYERDPVFMYLYRRGQAGIRSVGLFSRADKWLGELSLHEKHARSYGEARGFASAVNSWLEGAKSELAELETKASSEASRAIDELAACEMAVAAARCTAERAQRAMLSLIDQYLTDYVELDRQADLLIARECAAARVRALIKGREEEPLPLAFEQEQCLAVFAEAKRLYEAAVKGAERLNV